MNPEDLKSMLVLSANRNLEFRNSARPHVVGRVVCAFLNSGGGRIVGADANGEIGGIDGSPVRIADLAQSIHQDITSKALISFETHEIQGKAVLFIEVPAGMDTIRNLVMRRQIEPERWERTFSSAEIESDLSQDEILVLEGLSASKYGRLTNAGDVLLSGHKIIRSRFGKCIRLHYEKYACKSKIFRWQSGTSGRIAVPFRGNMGRADKCFCASRLQRLLWLWNSGSLPDGITDFCVTQP
jgi:predicted HTH transcriptional regulator